MKKTKEQLKAVESLIQKTYNRRGRILRETIANKFDPKKGDSLGYSWRFDDDTTGNVVYNVFVSSLGKGREHSTYRVKMHEYGHIYYGHFDGIYEELDSKIAYVLKNYRGQIIETINKNCGVSIGEKLVEKVLDDKQLNHSLHNIAMDMEVNSCLLSNEDIAEMEEDITAATVDSYGLSGEEAEEAMKANRVKLVLPCRYHTKGDIPFPDELTYPEYLIMIIRNLDQFVKYTISIANGGSGDTSGISTEEVQEALSGNGSGNEMQSLEEYMRQAGMSDGNGQGKGKGNGEGEGDPTENGKSQQDGGKGSELGQHDTSNSGGFKENSEEKDSSRKGKERQDTNKTMDHYSPSQAQADKSRELGNIQAGGGFGCGEGASDATREVSKTDCVDTAIEEVILKTKSKVVKRTLTRNVIRNYNLGKNRTVIAPSIIAKNRIDTKPKLVFILDISGSMDTVLVDRILNSISTKMKQLNRGLVYGIIT